MDDVLGLNLPPTQATQIQSIWLYLCITVLSEIMNHSGTQILPHALQHLWPTPTIPTDSTTAAPHLAHSTLPRTNGMENMAQHSWKPFIWNPTQPTWAIPWDNGSMHTTLTSNGIWKFVPKLTHFPDIRMANGLHLLHRGNSLLIYTSYMPAKPTCHATLYQPHPFCYQCPLKYHFQYVPLKNQSSQCSCPPC